MAGPFLLSSTGFHEALTIEKHLGGVKYLSVAWFGGEPLVGMPVIESLSQRIIALCKEKNVQYSASIITNGYLLTKEVAEKLKEYHVRSAQITVDGPKEIHDTRRPMANGQGTYDVIMEHLAETKGIQIGRASCRERV